MANVYAVKNGNWSDTTLWNTGSLPAVIDDVYANTYTVYVDGNYQVSSVRNLSATSITQGGSFILNNGISLSAFVIGGGVANIAAVQFLSASPATATIVGNISANGIISSVTNATAVIHSGTGTLTIRGSAIGATATGNPSNGYIRVTSSGTLNVFGDVYGGLTSTNFYGINSTGSGIVNIVGNCYAGTGTTNAAAYIGGTSTAFVTGNLIASTDSPFNTVTSGSATIIGNAFAAAGDGCRHGSTGVMYFYGNCTAGSGNGHAISNTSTGTLYIVGNCTAGSATNYGLRNNSTGTVFMTGNILGGSGSNAYGGLNNTTGSVTIVGNVSGGTNASAYGFYNGIGGITTIYGNGYGNVASGPLNASPTTPVTIYGDCYGGNLGSGTYGAWNNADGPFYISGNVYAGRTGPGAFNGSTGLMGISGSAFGNNFAAQVGANNNSTGTLLISGSAVGGAGSAAYGAFNNSTGILRVKRAVGNGWGLGYTTAVASVPGVFSSNQGSQTFVEELECGPRGQWPTGGVVFFTPNTKATSQFETDTFTNYTLIESNSADNLLPPVSSVRQGTTYNLGLSTGTCVLPPTSSVAAGTLVDNLTGTAVLTPQTTWNYSVTASAVNSMGGRLRNALNTNSANNLINSFNP